jgi:hypothetical protein
MAMNPVRGLMSDPESKSTPIGTELAEKVKMRQEADKALAPTSPLNTLKPVAEPVKAIPAPPAKWEKVHPGNKAPTGREALDKMNAKYPGLPKMHTGGTVPKTGPYEMKEGEHVLTPEKHEKLKHAMGLAASALSHDPAEEKEPELPKKEVREMHMRKGANGGFIVKHLHVHAHLHPEEEHVHSNMDGVHDHLEQHWGEPNDGEGASENEKDESPGVQAAEKALGYK